MTAPANWRASAACASVVRPGFDPFFTDTAEATATALAVCSTCHVRTECLTYAVRTGQRWGIWGGHPQRSIRQLVDDARAGRSRHRGNHRNAVKTHCRHGHPFTKSNTYYSADGRRYCRTCARLAWRRSQGRGLTS